MIRRLLSTNLNIFCLFFFFFLLVVRNNDIFIIRVGHKYIMLDFYRVFNILILIFNNLLDNRVIK